MNRRNAAIAAAIVLAIGAFFALGLDRVLSLDFLKEAHQALLAMHAEHPVKVTGMYFVVYVAVTALSLPGATVLTLAGGALFGLFTGTLLVSFASSLGALLAFFASRTLLRETVRKRFGRRLEEIDAGVERDGALYLATLRLVPVVPFFVINLAMGLTAIRARTYYAVSQAAMLPATIVYVNAGTQLATLDSLAGILTPSILGSLVLLALFPWLARRGAAALQARKVHARWRGLRPRRFERNLVVIGAGAAGLVSAYIGAALKASVTLVERHKMGGDCLNYGCIPSKALIRSATLAHQMRHADRYGLAPTAPPFSFHEVMQRVRAVIRAVEPHDSAERYRGLGVDVVEGHAKIVDPWTVEVALNGGGTRRITTRSIVIAAGAEPVVPALDGLEAAGYVTSDTLWSALEAMDRPPARLVVLGGGPIGCELAQAFARLGSQVTQVERSARLLTREDDEVSALVQQALAADGVRVLAGHEALRCETRGEDRFLVVVRAEGGEPLEIAFDMLVCAVGRRARLTGYGLEELGIPTDRTVEADAFLRTRYPHILAAGDAAGPWQFTHTAAHQAWYATVNALFGGLRRFKVDHGAIPAATFVDPEVARVGLNECEAKAQGIDFEVVRYGLDDLDRAIADGEARGFVKVLTVPGKDRILGATIVGPHASELLAEFVLAMKHGLGLGKILGTIHTYPTWSEGNKYAAGEWRRAHQPARLLRWVARYHAWRRG
jgi:pyruvate/2-oxoglutarate dehydrogenase complex dihydrolipoamide dehydrogenase (E3) component/uncharacterized membrane protein YdjX (TVP38/TMEM64 family)